MSADTASTSSKIRTATRTYRAASTLGLQYMLPKYFGEDREEADRWYELQQEALDGLPGVDTVRLEYQDVISTNWAPVEEAGDIPACAWRRPPARVITGDVDTVTAELDALPVGTVIRIVEDEDGPQVFEGVAAHGHNAPPIMWSPTRSPGLVDSGYIARGETAVTILWAGESA